MMFKNNKMTRRQRASMDILIDKMQDLSADKIDGKLTNHYCIAFGKVEGACYVLDLIMEQSGTGVFIRDRKGNVVYQR